MGLSSEKLHPRVGVGVCVERGGKVLLGLRKGSCGAATWAFPGGHLEFAEGVEACAKRELLEETGLRVTSCTLGPWFENMMEKKHYITLLVMVDQFEGEVKLLEPDKCESWQWFSLDALPQPLFPTLVSQLAFLRNRVLVT